jgi:hypothetical protein
VETRYASEHPCHSSGLALVVPRTSQLQQAAPSSTHCDDDDHYHKGFAKFISVSICSSRSYCSIANDNSPILPKDFNANQPKTIRLYPLSNYTFGTKDGQPEEDPSVLARLKRLEEHYTEHGMRRTCEGILVCHEHNHPHILMLQIANAFFKLYVGSKKQTVMSLMSK